MYYAFFILLKNFADKIVMLSFNCVVTNLARNHACFNFNLMIQLINPTPEMSHFETIHK